VTTVQMSTANESLCRRLANAIRWLAEYVGFHDDHDARADSYVTSSGHTLWYMYQTGWTEVVADSQIVFESDPNGRATTFVEGPWIAEVLALTDGRRKDAV